MRLIGLVFTIVAVLLTSAAGFGQERLQSWEARLREWLGSRSIFENVFRPANWAYQRTKKAPGQVMSSFSDYYGGIAFLLVLLIIVGTFFFPKLLGIYQILPSSNVFVDAIIFTVALIVILFLISMSFYVFALVIALVIWLLTLPYRLLDRFATRIKYQSTLLMLGAVLSIIVAVVGFAAG